MVDANCFLRSTLRTACAVVFLLAALPVSAEAQGPRRTSLTVEVKDAATGEPINQAHLTLQFREPGDIHRLKRPEQISYSAKTNPHGRYKFPNIPKGTIRLLVTAERHQSFGKEFELEQDNQVIEIKLKKPQPLL